MIAVVPVLVCVVLLAVLTAFLGWPGWSSPADPEEPLLLGKRSPFNEACETVRAVEVER